MKPGYQRPLDFKHGRIDMNHGAGGRASAQLIAELFARAFDNPALRAGDDGAVLDLPEPPPGQRLVMATDGHVISPLEFPGGDIGCLAVHGTLNDVAMMGAVPVALTASFVLEEGLALATLKRIVESMAAAARDAGVPIVTGDTKVVEQGKGDGVFISTTGLGLLPAGRRIGGARARAGDVLLLSGTIGDHGVAVLSQRESLGFEASVRSDTAALHGLVAALLAAVPEGCGAHTARPHARRPGDHAERDRPPGRRGHAAAGDGHCGAARGRGRLRAAGPGPAVRGQRGQAGGRGGALACRCGAGRAARPSAGPRGRAHRRGGGR